MRQVPLGLLALIGLQGCVYYVERPPRRPHPPHHRPDGSGGGGGGGGWDTSDPGEDDPNWDPEEPAIKEGRWIFALSAPLVEGGCDLDGVTELTVEGVVKHIGPSTISIETPLAVLEGEVMADQLAVSGRVTYEDVRGEVWVSGVLDGPTRLYGMAEGEGEGCFLHAELTGYAITQ